jgi:hypothetical protein
MIGMKTNDAMCEGVKNLRRRPSIKLQRRLSILSVLLLGQQVLCTRAFFLPSGLHVLSDLGLKVFRRRDMNV